MLSANAFNLEQSKILLCGKRLKELQESMDMCIRHGDITEILLKKALKHRTINKSYVKVTHIYSYWSNQVEGEGY